MCPAGACSVLSSSCSEKEISCRGVRVVGTNTRTHARRRRKVADELVEESGGVRGHHVSEAGVARLLRRTSSTTLGAGPSTAPDALECTRAACRHEFHGFHGRNALAGKRTGGGAGRQKTQHNTQERRMAARGYRRHAQTTAFAPSAADYPQGLRLHLLQSCWHQRRHLRPRTERWRRQCRSARWQPPPPKAQVALRLPAGR